MELTTEDIIKIENVFLNDTQIEQISILAPDATISLIEDFKVIEKKQVKLPEKIKRLIKCVNKTCITNSTKEPIDYEFYVLDKKPLKIQCVYCDRIYKLDEIIFTGKEKIEKKLKQKLEL